MRHKKFAMQEPPFPALPPQAQSSDSYHKFGLLGSKRFSIRSVPRPALDSSDPDPPVRANCVVARPPPIPKEVRCGRFRITRGGSHRAPSVPLASTVNGATQQPLDDEDELLKF
jgi:hypothetical protein